MKAIAIIAAIIAAMLLTLAAFAQAETTNICDRTPAVRDAILKATSADDCAAVGLASVASLDIRGWHNFGPNRLAYLRPDDFDGLANLQSLNLHGNDLASLPAGVFDGLASLETLDLGLNQLGKENIKDRIILGLNIIPLKNKIKEVVEGEAPPPLLPSGLFAELGSLKELYLRYNKFTTLPEGFFNGLGGLECLALSGNQLTSLKADDFDGLGGLQELYLDNNQLTALPDGVFDGLGNLRILTLYGNQLTALPEIAEQPPVGLNCLGIFDRLNSKS